MEVIDLTIANPSPVESFLCVCFSKRLNKVASFSFGLSQLLATVNVRLVTVMEIVQFSILCINALFNKLLTRVVASASFIVYVNKPVSV